LRVRHGHAQALPRRHPPHGFRLARHEEGTSYGTPAWRHKGKLLARLHQDGESIVLKVGNATRDHLLQADPETFFVTDHYIGYPMVLARLDKLSAADLKKLLLRSTETTHR